MVKWIDSPAVPENDTEKHKQTQKQLAEICYGPIRFQIENESHGIIT
jgi:hypothetical protein